MMRIKKMLAVLLLAGLCNAVATIEAQDKKAPNVQEFPKKARENVDTRAVRDLELAFQLIQYGRSNKHAESLLVAAQILHKTPTQPLKVDITASAARKADVEPLKIADNSPRALVVEAKKMAASPAVKNLVEATWKIVNEDYRGPLGGARVTTFTIRPGQEITLSPITFVGGETAIVQINNGQFGCLVLEVTDDSHNVVANNKTPGSQFKVQWTPAATGPFRVCLRNLDAISFQCTFSAN